MATALFITKEDVVKNTSLSGSLDSDKFLQYVQIAQEIHVQNILGTDLYNKISTLIIDGSGTMPDGNYKDLVKEYIKPILIHFGMVEYLGIPGHVVRPRNPCFGVSAWCQAAQVLFRDPGRVPFPVISVDMVGPNIDVIQS